jgi:hypothetical protein
MGEVGMINFQIFLQNLRDDLKSSAPELGVDLMDALIEDGLDFVHKTREDIEKWSHQLAKGELSKDEFEWLILAKKDLAEMEALKQKGLALANIDQYKHAITYSVLKAVFKSLG